MTSIFSAISGQFTRSIVLGALLPAIVFVIAVYLLVLPLVPWQWHVTALLEAVEPQWKAAIIGIVAILVAGVLHVFNTPIIRLFEGYPWQNGPL
jgi:uncharacterized PurR-regulated membrane protein YhhQ (DUF165 family)